MEPTRAGADVRAQNVLGTLDHDVLGAIDKVAGPFTPVGFYYRTMMRPRWAWRYYEHVLRNLAGLGRIDRDASRTRRFDTEHRRVQVLVIGGGAGGTAAAREATAAGEQVVLVDEGLAPDLAELRDLGVDVIAPARAIGIYEGGLVPVDAGNVLLRFRAQRIVVATGAIEQPLLFPGNDLVGVMLPSAVRRLVHEWSLKPGERAVVIGAGDVAEDLRAAGVEVAAVVPVDGPREIEAHGRRGRIRSVTIDGRRISCDLLVASGVRQPAYSLLAQAGAKIAYDESRGIFIPTELPAKVTAAGAVTGTDSPIPRPSYTGNGKCFVCICEDVTDKDVRRAIAEGFDSIELAKRYTTVTMGPCQGRLCHLGSIRLYARETTSDEAAIGTTTARPPWAPVTLGLLAGRGHEPAKRTSLHHRHEELGARMMWTGDWRRVHSYGDPADETRAVHEAVGVIDVSTLGKLLVSGPDAAAFLERLYPNRFADLKPGRIRYAVLGTDSGRIMDDGTVGRLSAEQFYVTTTSTGAEAVLQWFEWWNAIWLMDVEILDVTGALAAMNVAGPGSRELLGQLTPLDVSREGFTYLDLKEAPVADIPCLLLRIGFVGELGYEVHCASPLAEHLWDSLLGLGARPFGLEAQRILRLEKQHIIVGQDTDSESNALDAGMPWIVKLDKDDFVGKWALEHMQERGPRERLVGFEMEKGAAPPEGAQVVIDGRPAGRVTSSRSSAELRKAIGLAWVPPALAEEGARIEIRMNGSLERAAVRLQPFFDPKGERLRS